MLELRIDRVSKCYKKKIAVDQVELTFHRGVYGLLGENGAGKTTLLRMLAGILTPTMGEIRCNGCEIRRMGGDYRRLLGYLPQDFGFYPDFTAVRFLTYLAQLKAVPPGLIAKQINELLEQTGLTEVKNRKIRTFSGGMVRRLGIAQSLLNEPEILLLDEPTSGLDPKERIRFRNMISTLGRNRIVLLSSHIVSDIEFIADRILMMKEGRIIENGTLGDILQSAAGRVWEYSARPEEVDRINSGEFFHVPYTVSNLRNAEDCVSVRIVSGEKPSEDSIAKEPGLEDVYLYHFGTGGREQEEKTVWES